MEKYEYQQAASGLLESTEKNLLIIAPTGAGKTLVGYEAIEKYGKGVYIAPTRALCYEKYQELQGIYPGKRIVLGNKDYSLGRNTFRGSDFRVITPWKLNQFLQNNDWFEKAAPVIVFDEIHGLNADFEIIITKLKEMYPSVRLIGLSATVSEEDEAKFASWLDAVVVKSEERPVPLIERVVFFDANLDEEGNELTVVKIYENNNLIKTMTVEGEIKRNTHLEILHSIIREQDTDEPPVLWFSPYRGRAAEIASFLTQFTSFDQELENIASLMPAEASEFSEDLKTCLPQNCGFHHGGLSQQEAETVFQLAKSGKLKNIATCLTLAQGVNLPARHIVMDTIYDYGDAGIDNEKRLLDVTLFRQLQGRAGRPQFDSIGYCWIPVFSEVELVEVEEVLLKYKASKLESRIFNNYFLTATLPQLAQFGFDTPEKIAGFIKATFWGKAMQDTFPLMDQLQKIVSDLIDLKVVKVEEGKLVLTFAGGQTARLTLHPKEYFVIDGLVKDLNIDYEEWISRLIDTASEYVLGPDHDSEKISDCIEALKMYGLTIYCAKSKHYVRDMGDYISRLLDITRSYFKLNRRMDDYAEQWEEQVGTRFLFGELVLAKDLSAVLRRDQLKRLIRNVGPSLSNCEIHDEPTKRQIARLLFSETLTTPNGTATKVAEIIGAETEEFHELVEEERRKFRERKTSPNLSLAEEEIDKEVLA